MPRSRPRSPDTATYRIPESSDVAAPNPPRAPGFDPNREPCPVDALPSWSLAGYTSLAPTVGVAPIAWHYARPRLRAVGVVEESADTSQRGMPTCPR